MMVQTPPESTLHWLYTNAPAAWISALAALTVLILKLRKRPKRIVVRELPSVSLLSISPGLRHRITTTFDGRPINALSFVVYEMYNEGSEPIQNATFTVTLPEGTVVLESTVRPRDCEPKYAHADNRVTVSLPYLNPFREHKQILSLYLLADGETRHAKASGSGEGWSVRYSPLPGPKQMRRGYLIPLGVGLVIGVVTAFYQRYVAHILRIGPPEVAYKLLLALVPVLVVSAGAFWLSGLAMKRMWYRAFRWQDPDLD